MANSDYTPPVFPCTSRVVARNSITQARFLIQELQLTLASADGVLPPSVRPAVGRIGHELAIAENALNLCGC
jgi:hypothetical protein